MEDVTRGIRNRVIGLIREDENIHIDRYIGQKYNIEIRSIGNKIQSILYVYKY